MSLLEWRSGKATLRIQDSRDREEVHAAAGSADLGGPATVVGFVAQHLDVGELIIGGAHSAAAVKLVRSRRCWRRRRPRLRGRGRSSRVRRGVEHLGV